MRKVLLVWKDGRKTIVDILEMPSPDATLKILGPLGFHSFLPTEKIENGLDVYEEERTLNA
jgi:hypothetical protein